MSDVRNVILLTTKLSKLSENQINPSKSVPKSQVTKRVQEKEPTTVQFLGVLERSPVFRFHNAVLPEILRLRGRRLEGGTSFPSSKRGGFRGNAERKDSHEPDLPPSSSSPL